MKERYINYEKAGDQFVGRTVCGLCSLSAEFAVSPCYFDFSNEDDPNGKKEQINAWIRENVVGGRNLDSKIIFMIRYLFASVCFHFNFLKEHCHPRNRLLSESLFTRCPEDLRSLAVVKYPWNKTSDTPIVTGVPPHVINT